MISLKGAEAEKGEPEKLKECCCKLNLGICSPFINPRSTEEDPLYKELPSSLPEKLKMKMKEFDTFPNGVIAVPPDHEPFITKSQDPYKPKKNPKKRKAKSQELDKLNNPKKTTESSPELDKEPDGLAGFYAEDLLYGTVLAEVKKFDKQAFLMKGYMTSTFRTHLPDLANTEVDTLIVLPSRKLIIVIETKAAREDTSFPSKLKDGSKQCEKFHQFLKAAHWNILSEQWKLVKCVSLPLIDLEEDKNQRKIEENCGCCVFCNKYIIDERKVWISGLKTMLNSKL